MTNAWRWIGATAAAVVLTSCATDTPAARIGRNPATFQSLPASHQRLVEQGRIDRGMSPEAVQLAWGNPDRRSEGVDKRGASTMRWDYARLRPVYTTGFAGGYGWGRAGWNPYGRFGGNPYWWGVSPQVAYFPERKASVFFRNRKVEAWEQIR